MANQMLDYKRKMVTLNIPFRNEERDILAEMRFNQIYEENVQQVLACREEIEANLDIDKIIEASRKLSHPGENEEDLEILLLMQHDANSFIEFYNNPDADILPIRTESTPEALKTIKLLAPTDSTRDKIVLVDYEMKSLDTTKSHLQEAGDHVCGVCNERFGEESLLRLHERMHKRVFKCSKCADVCLSEELARQHYERCNIKRSRLYKCKKCVMQFTVRNEYRRHIRRAHVSFVYCDHCEKPFTAKTSLVRHLLIHSGDVPMLECKICKKKYRWQTGLYQHMMTHNNEKDEAIHCAECNVQFKNIHSYKYHLKYSRNHIKEQDLKFPCPHCEKRFNKNSNRKNHIESMHSNKMHYHCNECGKSFKALRRLREHVRSAHEGYKKPSNNLCVVCGRKFKSKTALNEHMNSHTGTRPFDCETCGATFAYSAALYTHKKKHKRCRRLMEQQKKKL